MFEGPAWKRFREMISENGKLSLFRVLMFFWFLVCFGMALMFIYAVGTAFVTGREMKFPVDLLSTITMFFMGIMGMLASYIFGSKTKLNFKNQTVEADDSKKDDTKQ